MKARPVTDKVTPALPARKSEDLEHFHQRALLAAIVDSSDDAIVSKTLEGRILSWNRGATRIFGYEPHEVIGKPITIIVPPELHAEELQILNKLRRGERIDHFDTVRVTKDGRRISISLTVSPIRSADGTVIAASKVARDVGAQAGRAAAAAKRGGVATRGSAQGRIPGAVGTRQEQATVLVSVSDNGMGISAELLP